MVLEIEKEFYINRINLNPHIVFKGSKFYNIQIVELKKEGFKFRKVINDYSEFEQFLLEYELRFYLKVYKNKFQMLLENHGYKFQKN